jgi:hypothetical protein
VYSDSEAALHCKKASEFTSWISGSFKQSDLVRHVLLRVLLHRTPEHVIAVKQASSDSSKREALWNIILVHVPDQSCCSWGTKRRTARVRVERWCTVQLNSGSVSPKLTSSRLTSLEYKSHIRAEWYLSRRVWEEMGQWHYHFDVPVYYLELMLTCTRHPGGAEVFLDCNVSSMAHTHKNWKPCSCVY